MVQGEFFCVRVNAGVLEVVVVVVTGVWVPKEKDDDDVYVK